MLPTGATERSEKANVTSGRYEHFEQQQVFPPSNLITDGKIAPHPLHRAQLALPEIAKHSGGPAIFITVLAAGMPVVALTRPFLPSFFGGTAALVMLLVMLTVAFWRSAASLEGHARAGAEVVASMVTGHTVPESV